MFKHLQETLPQSQVQTLETKLHFSNHQSVFLPYTPVCVDLSNLLFGGTRGNNIAFCTLSNKQRNDTHKYDIVSQVILIQQDRT